MKDFLKTLLISMAAAIVPMAMQAQYPCEKHHLTESKSLVGIWNQVGVGGINGIIKVKSENYKILNADSTFLVFMNHPTAKPALTLSLYGRYTVDSDSTYTEYIVASHWKQEMAGTKSMMRYKLIGHDQLLIEYYNESLKIWVPEVWKRVPFTPAGEPFKEL